MNKERMKIWLKLLESGKYKPTSTNSLCREGKYSPIGILTRFIIGEGKSDGHNVKWGWRFTSTPTEVAKWLGFASRENFYNLKTKSGG